MAGIRDVITTPASAEILLISGSAQEMHGEIALDADGDLLINAHSGSNILMSSGSVGIGTTVPADVLDLYGPSAKLWFHSSDTGGGTSNGTRIGLNGTEFYINNKESSTIKMYVGASQTTGITIINDGNVGIGTTSPSRKLDIIGSANSDILMVSTSTNRLVALGADATPDGQIRMFNSSDTQTVDIRSDSSNPTYFNGGGNLGIGTTAPAYALDVVDSVGDPYVVGRFHNEHVNAPYGGILVSAVSQSHVRFLNNAANWGDGGAQKWQIRLGDTNDPFDKLQVYSWTLGASVMDWNYDGNVGIGTTSPNCKLEVIGNVCATSFTGSLSGSVNLGGFSSGSVLFADTDGTIAEDPIFFVWDDSNNRLGIGTSKPSEMLSVIDGNVLIEQGGSGATADSSAENLVISDSSFGGISILTPDNVNSSLYFGSPSDNIGSMIYWRYNIATMTIGTGMTGGILTFITDNSSEVMRVQSDGNLGIGTTSPGRRLHLYDSAYTTVAQFESGQTAAYISIKDSGHSTYGGLIGSDSANSISVKFGDDSANWLMAIHESGNVGIGTLIPGCKLDVVGNVCATSFTGSLSGSVNLGGFSTGSVLFAGSDGTISEDPTKFYWDESINKLGIGTNNPQYTLDVYGGHARIGGFQTTAKIYLQATDTAGSSAETTLLVMTGYESRAQGIQYFNNSYSGEEWFSGLNYNGGNNAWSVGYSAAGGQSEYLENSILTAYHTGNVGIGTHSPQRTLDVSGSIRAQTAASGATVHADADELVLEGSGHSGMTIMSGTSSEGKIFFDDSGGQFRGFMNYDHSSDVLRFGTSATEAMRINSSGNLGIGTTAPAALLDVYGPTFRHGSLGATINHSAVFGGWTDGGSTPQYYTIGEVNLSGSSFDNSSAEIEGVVSCGRDFQDNPIWDFKLKYYKVTSTVTVEVDITYSRGLGDLQFYLDDATSTIIKIVALNNHANQSRIIWDINERSLDQAPVLVMVTSEDTSTSAPVGYTKVTPNVYSKLLNEGSVGIGTTAPVSQFHVETSTTGDQTLATFKNSDSVGGSIINIDRTGTERAASVRFLTGGTTTWYTGLVRYAGSPTTRYGITTNSDMSSVAPEFCISSGGNVGIGFANPAYTLDVSGSFRALDDTILGTANDDTHTITGNIVFGGNDGIPSVLGSGGTFSMTGRSNSTSLPIMQINKVGDSGEILTGQVNSADQFSFGTADSFIVSGLAVGTSTRPSGIEFAVRGDISGSGQLTIDGTGTSHYAGTWQSKTGKVIQDQYTLRLISDQNSVYDSEGAHIQIATTTYDAVGRNVFEVQRNGVPVLQMKAGGYLYAARLSSSGNFYLDGAMYDAGKSAGSANQVLVSTGTAIDWVDLDAVPGSVTGSGTTNHLAKWSSSNSLTASVVYESGGNVGIGTTSPAVALEISSTSAGKSIRISSTQTSIANDVSLGSLEFYGSDTSSPSAGIKGSINVFTAPDGSSIGNASYMTFNTSNQADGNNSERMRIDHTGHVGIGTTSSSLGDYSDPGNPMLHVYNTGTSGDTHVVARFQAGPDANLSAAGILINHSNDRGLLIGAGRQYGDNGFATFSILSSVAAATDVMTLTQAGNVGIGTTTPTGSLEVAGSSPKININSTSGNPELQFSDGGTDEFSMYYDTGGNYFTFVEGGVGSHMVIEDGGNIGIGTTGPIYPLHVEYNASSAGLYIKSSATFDGSTSKASVIYLGDAGTAVRTQIGHYDSQASIGGAGETFFIHSGNGIDFAADSTSASAGSDLHINSSGNIGMGTTSSLDHNLVIENDINGDAPILALRSSDGGFSTGQQIEVDFQQGSATVGRVAGEYYGSSLWGVSLHGNEDSALHKTLSVVGKNVGIGSTIPDVRLDVSGSIKVFGQYGIGAETDNGTSGETVVLYPGGAQYGYRTSTGGDGYLKIQLPATWNDAMIMFYVDIYQYQSGKSKTMCLSGYMYNGGTAWLNTSAWMTGDSENDTYTAHFGHDGTKCAIYLENGDGGSTSWGSFGPHVIVRDFHVGFSATDFTTWDTGWDISVTGSLGTVSATRTMNGTAKANGSANYIAKFDSTYPDTLENSIIYESGGNIGIGTTVPDRAFHIVGSSNVSSAIRITNTNTTPDNDWQIHASYTNQTLRFTANTGSVEVLTLQDDGNVGIGTNAPVSEVHVLNSGQSTVVIGSSDGSGSGVILDGSANGDAMGGDYAFINHDSGGTMAFSNNGTGGDYTFVTSGSNAMAVGPGYVSIGRHGGTGNPLDVYSNTANVIAKFTSTTNGSTGAQINIFHDSTSPADDDKSSIQFTSNDSGGTERFAALIQCWAADVNAGSVDGDLVFQTYRGNSASEVMRITHDENVGIGNTSPQSLLHIGGNVNTSSMILFGRTEATSEAYQPRIHQISTVDPGTSQDLALGACSSNGAVSIYTGVTTSQYALLGTNNNAARLTVINNGNVGIGTTVVDSPLVVSRDFGAAGLTAANLALSVQGSSVVGGGASVRFDVSTSATSASYHARIDGVRTGDDNGSSEMRFWTTHAGTEATARRRMTINSIGRVGIGTTNPTYKLHVYGSDANTEPINNIQASMLIMNSNTGDDTTSALLFGATESGGAGYIPAGIVCRRDNGSTTRTADLEFYTCTTDNISSGNLRMLINNTGNIGMGSPTGTESSLRVKSHGSNANEISLEHSGNTVTIAALGQVDSHGSLTLYTNGSTEKVRLLATGSSFINGGNVGIGTTAPTSLLEVMGPAVGANTSITLGSGASNIYGRNILFGNQAGSNAAAIAITPNTIGTDTTMDFYVGGASAGDIKMTIDDDGDVGIGTTAPTSLLEVYGGAGGSSITIGSSGANTLGRSLRFRDQAGTTGAIIVLVPNTLGTDAELAFYVGGGGAGDLKMTIDDDGDVGIGAAPSGEKLYVNGEVRFDITTTAAGGSGGKTWQTWGLVNVSGTNYYVALYQ